MFDDSVRVALRERAEGAVHVEELLAGARRRGVRRRRVRYALLGGATALAVALAGVTIPRTPTDAEREAAEIRSVSTLPRPPLAGSRDTNVLRLDVADPDADWLVWTAEGDGRQMLGVDRKHAWDGAYNGGYTVVRGRSEADLDSMMDRFEPPGGTTERVTIGGVTGARMVSGAFDDGGRWASLRWRGPDGTWLGARVSATTIAGSAPDSARNAVLQVPQWVRVNVSYRCVADFRLGWAPPGTRAVGCRTNISATGRSYAIVFATPDQGEFLAYTEVPTHPDAVSSVDQWQARFMTNLAGKPYGRRTFVVGAPGLSKEDAQRVADGFVELDDPIPTR